MKSSKIYWQKCQCMGKTMKVHNIRQTMKPMKLRTLYLACKNTSEDLIPAFRTLPF